MAGQDLDLQIHLRPDGIDEPETMRGQTEDRLEIGVVRFVPWVGGLPILLGGEGVDEADVPSGGAKGALNGAMVLAGAFDGND